ncbi:OLC1v1034710C2 [Oldenlandia corymbosa var. corymbosa]|nr:OLC1v1034710C2 [Oldenlandia corymbosa var. corymbosa]
MEWEWLKEFGKSMIKPLLGLSVLAIGLVMSYFQKLGLVRETACSILRASVQLLLIGFVLHYLFNLHTKVWMLGVYLFMTCVAGYTAGQRAEHVPRGKYVAGISIFAGTSVTLFVLIMLRTIPFTARYVIPIAGLMVGNTMRVTGITMKRLRDDIRMQKALVETALALGATPREATLQLVKRSLIIALCPTLDNAKTIGLVSLPGAMSGLILGGASPLEAIRIQLVIMNMVIGSGTVSSIVSTHLSRSSFFTEAYQLQTTVFNVSD